MRRRRQKQQQKNWKIFGGLGALVVAILAGIFLLQQANSSNSAAKSSTSQVGKVTYTPSKEEKEYLTNRFNGLKEINPETVAYVYAPGTELDEPVVQTGDNSTYLDKTFEGGNEPYLGTVFMDTENKKDFSDRLTWLFGYARASQVGDHRMFNDVHYYDKQE